MKLTITPTVTASSGNAAALAATTLSLALVADGASCSSATYTWSKTGSGAASGSLATLASRDRLTGSTATPAMRLCARSTLSSGAPIGAKNGTVSYAIALDGVQAW